MSALSDLVGSETDKHDAGKRFALAVNTIALVAPGDVIAAIMAFVEESSDSHVAKQEKLNR